MYPKRILKNWKMILKKLFKKTVKFYQYFISPLLGNNCRYYPSCSEYALWEIECDNVFMALFKSLVRILRCNQLFKGGIDYPIIKRKIKPFFGIKKEIVFWLIPVGKNKYLVIKAHNE